MTSSVDFLEKCFSFGLRIDELGALLGKVVGVIPMAFLQVILSQVAVRFTLLVSEEKMTN